ncbi:MAG: hypothetical protein AAGL96_10940 [Pseudomonadota bacterium]
MRAFGAIWLWLVCVVMSLTPAQAELIPLGPRAPLLGATAPLVHLRADQSRGSPSLFSGRNGTSMFAPRPAVLGPQRGVAELLSLIAKAEAGAAGYDAVQYGAWIKPDGPPTTLTLAEIYDWIDATPGMPHAIGRYQFIPPTLRRLVGALDLPPTTRFSPPVQDALADLLLAEAGLDAFRAGELSRHGFMNNLAKIWAGLPNDTGKSHYHGLAGNKATMTWTYFDQRMAQIFPG